MQKMSQQPERSRIYGPPKLKKNSFHCGIAILPEHNVFVFFVKLIILNMANHCCLTQTGTELEDIINNKGVCLQYVFEEQALDACVVT